MPYSVNVSYKWFQAGKMAASAIKWPVSSFGNDYKLVSFKNYVQKGMQIDGKSNIIA